MSILSQKQDINTGATISSPEINDGNVSFGGSSFRIRDVGRIELIHDDNSTEDLVRVFVGVVDHDAKPIFTPVSYKREYIGNVASKSDNAEAIREISNKLDIPMIEI